MTRYYFNENPQHQALLDKIESLTNELHKIERLEKVTNEGFLKMNTLFRDMRDSIVCFNKLPWYKKLFYKFKV